MLLLCDLVGSKKLDEVRDTHLCLARDKIDDMSLDEACHVAAV